MCKSSRARPRTWSTASRFAPPCAASWSSCISTRQAASSQRAQSYSSCLPVNDELIIEARVNPSEIWHVKEGQRALVKLTALNQRLTPMIEGKVIYLSADALAAQQLAASAKSERETASRPYYVVRVRLDQQDAHRQVENFRPTPGMPADVFIKTGERTFFDYIMRPVLDSFSKAFREH